MELRIWGVHRSWSSQGRVPGRGELQKGSGKEGGGERERKERKKKRERTLEVQRVFHCSSQQSTDEYIPVRKITEARKEQPKRTRGIVLGVLKWLRNNACSHKPDEKT